MLWIYAQVPRTKSILFATLTNSCQLMWRPLGKEQFTNTVVVSFDTVLSYSFAYGAGFGKVHHQTSIARVLGTRSLIRSEIRNSSACGRMWTVKTVNFAALDYWKKCSRYIIIVFYIEEWPLYGRNTTDCEMHHHYSQSQLSCVYWLVNLTKIGAQYELEVKLRIHNMQENTTQGN